MARSLRVLGVCVKGSDPERASTLTAESAALAESIGDTAGLTAALNNLAIIAIGAGNDRLAAETLARALSIARQSATRRGCCVYLMNLGDTERRLGEFQAARAHLAESFATARELGYREVVVEVLYGLAALTSAAGDHRRAATLLGAAQREGDFGHVLEDLDRDIYEQTTANIRQRLGPENMEQAIAAGRELTLGRDCHIPRGRIQQWVIPEGGSLTPQPASNVSSPTLKPSLPRSTYHASSSS
jgi:tetratricopeptide (TPR) repeat protein